MRQPGHLPEASTVDGSLEPDKTPHDPPTLTNDIGLMANGMSGNAINAEKLSSTELIELLQADQLQRWRSGQSPSAESYLNRWPILHECEDALDLVYAEVLLRRERGESPSLAEYQERFPRFAEPLRLHFELEPWMAEEPVSSARMSTQHDPRPHPGASALSRRIAPMVPGYEIEGELGRGGMGVVYKARHIRLNRVCVLKMILAGAHADPEAFVRFLGEAEAVARLNHPHIIQIHHTGEVDGLPFLELEYVDGESLAAQLNGTPWVPRRAAVLVEILARAMAEAHRQGVVHRDLKPANILLASDGTPKITDFGLAKALGSDSGLTRTNSVIGSPSYMAPEQAQGHARDAGPTTDVYSLGAILYELLTGRPPFKAATVAETMDQVRSLEPVVPARLVPGLPRDVETICLTCLRKEPSRRYASTLALAEDLERFLGGRVIRSRRSTHLERGWRWARRNRTVALLLSALVLTMVSGFAGSILLWRRAENEADKALLLASSETSLRGAAQVQAASLALDRGLALADDGDSDRALHWFARAAQTAPSSEPGLIQIARANLASFGARMPVLTGIYTAGDTDHQLSIGPDARTVLEFGPDGFAQLKNAVTGRDLSPPLPHSAPVNRVAFSPDGTVVATWSQDRYVRLWSVPEGRPLAAWLTPEFPAKIFFNPSRHMIATIGRRESAGTPGKGDIRLRFWELPGGREIDAPAINFDFSFSSAVFSPDGTTLAFGYRRERTNSGETILWDLRTGKALPVPISDPAGFHVISFSADSKKALLLSMTKAVICDVKTGHPAVSGPIRAPNWPEVNTRDEAVLSSGFLAPDGQTIGTADNRGYVQFWDATADRLRGPIFRHGSSVNEMAVSPDGQTALIVGGFTARLYDVPTGQPLGGKMNLFPDSTAARTGYRALTFDAEGRTAAIVSGCTATVWDIRPVRGGSRVIPHRTGSGPLAFSPDGARLLTGSHLEPTARLWNTTTGEPVGPVLVHDSPRSGGGSARIHVVAFSPDGRLAITAGEDRFVRFWDPLTGKPLGRPLLQPHWVMSAAFSPDGKKLLVGTAAGLDVLWDLSGDPVIRKIIKGAGAEATGFAFNPDGHTALVRSNSSNPLLIDTATGDVIRTLSETVASSGFVFLAGGQGVLCLSGGSLRRFDPQSGSTLGPLFGSLINAFAVSPDGRIALTGGEDGALRTWNAATGTAVGSAMARRSSIRAVAFSPDGRTAAAGDQDGTVRFWNVATRRQVGPAITLDVQASRLVFSPDGRVLAANGNFVRICDVPSVDRVVAGRADLWAQVRTGHHLEEGGGMIPLERRDWERLRREIEPAGADLAPFAAPKQPDEQDLDWHERHAWESERQQLWYSALWHLDRMIAIRPDAAWLHARRVRALHSMGLDAAAEEARFRALASTAQQEAWDSEEAIRHEISADWSAAIAYYDRLVALTPADDWVRHRRARVLGRLGRWPDAAAELTTCLTPAFTSPLVYNERILAQLRADDRRGYRESCGELVARMPAAPSPFTAYLCARACIEGPDAISDRSVPIHLAETALNGFHGADKADALVTLGAANYRAGRIEEAVHHLTEAARQNINPPRLWAYLAMAHLAAGHDQRARPWLERLATRAPGPNTDDFWDQVEIEVLNREVEAVRKNGQFSFQHALPDNAFAPPH